MVVVESCERCADQVTKEFARRPSVAGLALLWGPVHKWGEMRFSVLAFSSHILLVGENESAGKSVVTQVC